MLLLLIVGYLALCHLLVLIEGGSIDALVHLLESISASNTSTSLSVVVPHVSSGLKYLLNVTDFVAEIVVWIETSLKFHLKTLG